MLANKRSGDTALSADPDQTVALRRRRLRRAMAALDHAVELAGRGVQPGQRRRRARRARPRSADRRHRHRRDQHPRRAAQADAPHRRAWRARTGRHRRRAIQRISSRGRYRPAAARSRHPGDDRRLPRLRLPVDAARDPRGYPAGAGARHLDLRRRSRGAYRRGDRGRRARHAEAALQLHEGPAGPRQHRLAALPALRFRAAHRRQRDELRRRPRLPLPMLVLHHHQRAGTQIALPHPRQRRAHPAHELGAGRQPLLHHRRQFCPQQGLGSDLRPHHQAARRGRHGRPLHDPGRHALPPHPELHREIAPRRRHPRVHRAGEHQPGQSDRRQEAAEQDHRVPQDAAGVEAATAS